MKWATTNEFNGSEQEYGGSFDCRGSPHLIATIGWGDGYVKNVTYLYFVNKCFCSNVCRRQHMYLLSNRCSSTAIYANAVISHSFDSMGLRRDKGEHFQIDNLSAPFLLCYLSVRMVQLHSPFVWYLWILGLGGELAAGCLRSRPAWIVFCFHCWVTDGKDGGRWRGLALGAGWRWLWAAPAIPALSPSCGALPERQKRPSGPILLCFSIIGTKLCGVRDSLPVFCRVVIASSRYSRNARHSNRVCQASSSRPLVSQLEHSGLSASFMQNR